MARPWTERSLRRVFHSMWRNARTRLSADPGRLGSESTLSRRTSMSIGKKLLVFSPKDEHATDLVAATSDWGCLVTTCETLEQFRGRLEGGDFDIVLCEESATLKSLIAESDPGGEILRTPLAEIEKRHILRVLSATNGNKTRAAKILGIDAKTLYNKLKNYGAAAQSARARKRAGESGAAGS
ncbi:MAG: hypothetical protein KDB80_09540 [Planctomycetes bacterium]|nr:hypothetical protein [Planctomycetota bacterium]